MLIFVFLVCVAAFLFSDAMQYMAMQEQVMQYETTNRQMIHEATVTNAVNRLLPANETLVIVATATPVK